jgi:hypothetical protein
MVWAGRTACATTSPGSAPCEAGAPLPPPASALGSAGAASALTRRLVFHFFWVPHSACFSNVEQDRMQPPPVRRQRSCASTSPSASVGGRLAQQGEVHCTKWSPRSWPPSSQPTRGHQWIGLHC